MSRAARRLGGVEIYVLGGHGVEYPLTTVETYQPR